MASGGTGESTPLHVLEQRIAILLPRTYQDYEAVQPVSMGSAGLVFDAHGKVAWNEMWATFCDLAMAGGPPHKGMLLEPAELAAIEADPERYRAVVTEIARGIRLVTRLSVQPSPAGGWVRICCPSDGMAGWLLRAITMENVSVRANGRLLDLPAGPHFRVEKEIKNVITAVAKTCHYWLDHMPSRQQQDVRALFIELDKTAPLLVPGEAADVDGKPRDADGGRLAAAVHTDTGLPASRVTYAGWLGFECPTVRAAIWMMRLLVVSNVLARREGTTIFVPLNRTLDPGGERVGRATTDAFRHAVTRGIIEGGRQ